MAYLNELAEKQVINDAHLARMHQSLESDEIKNHIEENEAEINAILYIHREGLESLLRKGNLDRNQLREWLEKTIQDKSRIQKSQKETRTETKSSSIKMEFRPVPARKFKMTGNDKFDVELTRETEVMSTLFTQKMCVDLFGNDLVWLHEPQSYIKGGPDPLNLNPGVGSKIQFGGSWYHGPKRMDLLKRNQDRGPNANYKYCGLRLVRTLK